MNGATGAHVLSGLMLLSGCGHYREEARVDDGSANVVVMTAEQEAFSCSTAHLAVSFGIGSVSLLSPDGQTLALQHETGVDLIAVADGSRTSLFGEAPTLDGARWSEDSERLAYFDVGVPAWVNRDGSGALTVAVDLAAAADGFSFQAAEWSHDGSKIAFATRGRGVLADAASASARVFSKTMVGAYGTPWPLAFSADDQTLAGLEAEDGTTGKRNVVLVDTNTAEAREVEGITHFSLVGWTADDSAIGLWDVGVQLWLVPRAGGEPRPFPGWASLPSPTTSEIALGGPGLHLVDPTTAGDRALLPEDWNVQGLRWSADGKTIGYLTTSGEHAGYLSVEDGTTLAEGFGVSGPDGWVAVPDPAREASGFLTRKLGEPASVGHAFAARNPDGTDTLEVTWMTQWLSDGSLAFLSSDGVHVASPSGSSNRAVCGVASSLVAPQGAHF